MTLWVVYKDGELYSAFESEWEAHACCSDSIDSRKPEQWERFKIRTYTMVDETQPRPR